MSREGGLRRGAPLRRLVGLVVGLAAMAFAPAALGATIDVKPGPDAIRKAMREAQWGDTLRIRDGTYRESLTIHKRLRFEGAGGRPTIDGGCDSRATLHVITAGTSLVHLAVVGAAARQAERPSAEVDVAHAEGARVRDVSVHDTCGGPGQGARYGIHVSRSDGVEVVDSLATGGFSGAGIHVEGLGRSGAVDVVADNVSHHSHRGIVATDSGAFLHLLGNGAHKNSGEGGEGSQPGGIFIKDSADVTVSGNVVVDNGHFGINLAPGSTENRLYDNTIDGNPIDLANHSDTNCGSGNGFETHTGPPLGRC